MEYDMEEEVGKRPVCPEKDWFRAGRKQKNKRKCSKILYAQLKNEQNTHFPNGKSMKDICVCKSFLRKHIYAPWWVCCGAYDTVRMSSPMPKGDSRFALSAVEREEWKNKQFGQRSSPLSLKLRTTYVYFRMVDDFGRGMAWEWQIRQRRVVHSSLLPNWWWIVSGSTLVMDMGGMTCNVILREMHRNCHIFMYV